MKVGFIGLGRMGAPMAARIAAAGHRVIGYDILPSKRELALAGVSSVASPAAAAADADVIVTSLPGPAEVTEVVRGGNGLLGSLRPSAILVETSTISPDLSRAIASEVAARNAFYLDAPISGGAHGARDGTLVAMVGGQVDALARARPIIACFAKEIVHLGPAGAGSIMKLVIQSIFLSQMAGFLEAVSMGERSGIPLDTLLSVVAASSAHHPAIGTRYGKLRGGDLDPMFEVASAAKDLSLAKDIWEKLGGPLPVLASALSDYEGAAVGGFAQADVIAVRNWLAARAPTQTSSRR
jgi:3-hydroxyisobutyrate dehydrogenase-like beta-hydroxyacid dehydrogenase